MLRTSRDAMYRLAKDPDDPFPIRYIGGKTRDGIVLHDELVAWVERNSVVGSPRGGSADGGRPEGARRPLPAQVHGGTAFHGIAGGGAALRTGG